MSKTFTGYWATLYSHPRQKGGVAAFLMFLCLASATAICETSTKSISSKSHSEVAPTSRASKQLSRVAAEMPGQIGVYAKRLSSGEEVHYNTDRMWYIASMVKIPVAIAVLQMVEKGELSLQTKVTLREQDYVDGTGKLLFQDPGTRLSIGDLIAHSIENSDSTATDLLMRQIGVDAMNQRIRENMVAEGITPFTTILQVRYDGYGELHPQADELSNMDYVEIRSAGDFDKRVDAFRKKLGLNNQDLKTPTLEKAFDRYYQRELNSARLPALGLLLERLVKGELLNAAHTDLVLDHMSQITTGDTRLSAGLKEGTPFAQKTGSQIARACNMGITHPKTLKKALIIVACAEDFDEVKQAESTFAKVARQLATTTFTGNR